ncbi:MAG: glycoside hydrolase family 92 protein [Sandaracinaceae bacterium]|nr:glycoside hydrolase family 92 protein [Sandaracinaceae bacterium]
MKRALLLCLLLVACDGSTPVGDDAGSDAGPTTRPDAGPPPPPPPSAPATEPLIDHVDPFIGTGGSGANDLASTYPGPLRPFGMVRPGPDTSAEGGAPGVTHCSGFAYADDYITGFSHMRMSGTGISDYGHVALMPVPAMEPSFVSQASSRSRFVEGSAVASPGYYAVTLERGDVRVELTATERVATHRYTFAPGAPLAVLVDVGHQPADNVDPVDGAITVDAAAREVSGFARLAGGYSNRFGGQQVYFVARFDRPFLRHGTWLDETVTDGGDSATGAHSGAYVELDPADGEVVRVEVAVSYVDVEGARANLDAESTGFDFDAVRAETERIWEEHLARVHVSARYDHDVRRFYTALYHVLSMPTLATDVDGRYRGLDDAIHEVDGFRYYTDFSLWDTFRTLHPLLTLLYPDYQLDMLRSLSAMAVDGGAMPRWPLGTGYTGGMLGDPAAMVFADSWVKGVDGFDLRPAYDALRRSAMGTASERFGGRGNAEIYDSLGYVPIERAGGSASKTLEFAYADWALAILADALGETEDAAYFRARSGNWRNTWDPARQFFVGRHEDGSFAEYFEDDRWIDYYTEGNGWQYVWYVPHDLPGLAEMMGGRDAMLDRLDEFFTLSAGMRITALPGFWYWHGNEPDLHAAFIFSALGDGARSARWSRWAAQTLYGDGPTGLPGNDDGGTLSAWLVFASMGIFTIAGEQDYLLGSPLLTRVEFTVGDGTFVIDAPDASDAAPRVREARLDGVALDAPSLPHSAIRAGSTLSLDMAE